MTLLASLVTRLSLESSSFSSGISKARRDAASSSTAIQKSLGRINGALTGLAAGISLAAFTAVAKRALDYASSLGEVSQQLGVTTRDLQVYRYAASQVGIEQETMDKGLAKLTQTMGQAQLGSDKAIKAFNAIGISLDDLRGKTAGQVIPLIAEALARIPDPARRAAIEVALFGKAGQKLDTLLAGGRRGIDELAQAAERLGIVLSDEQIQKADDTADKLAAVKQVLEARIAGVVADNATSILTLANSLAALTSSIVNFLGSNPERALGLLGALGGAFVGGRLAGLPGAIGGAALGYGAGAVTGGRQRSAANSENMDPRFRASELRKAANAYRQAQRQKGSSGGGVYMPGSMGSPAGNRGATVAATKKELDRQLALARKAQAQAAAKPKGKAGAAVVPSVDVPEFLGSGGGGGKKKGGGGKSAEQLAAEGERQRKDALRDAYDFENDQARNRVSILRVQQELATDSASRLSISREILGEEAEQEEAAMKLAVDLGELTQAQADVLRIQNERKFQLEREVIDAEEAALKRDDMLRLQETQFDLQREALDSEAQLADTAGERRAIEMKILDLAYRQERARLNAVLADEKAGEAAKEEARLRIAGLDARRGNDEANVRRGTMGPMESFLNSLPTTAAKANEALEAVAANGLQSLTDGLTDAIMGAKSLGDVFSGVAKQIIADLLKIAIQRAITAPLANALGSVLPSLAGAFGGSLGTTSASAGKNISNVKGYATGGSFKILGNRGIDTNLLSINGRPVAKVSHGEMATISPKNDNQRSGGAFHFDLRGAVVTQDLLNQMNAIGEAATVGGAGLALKHLGKSRRRALA